MSLNDAYRLVNSYRKAKPVRPAKATLDSPINPLQRIIDLLNEGRALVWDAAFSQSVEKRHEAEQECKKWHDRLSSKSLCDDAIRWLTSLLGLMDPNRTLTQRIVTCHSDDPRVIHRPTRKEQQDLSY